MKTIADLMDAFGGVTAFGRVIGKSQSAASEMKRRGAIHVRYWPAVIAAATARGIPGVTAERLMTLHAGEVPLPTPANDTRPTSAEDAA